MGVAEIGKLLKQPVNLLPGLPVAAPESGEALVQLLPHPVGDMVLPLPAKALHQSGNQLVVPARKGKEQPLQVAGHQNVH